MRKIFASRDSAEKAKPLAYGLVSKVAKVTGIGVVGSFFGFSIAINLAHGPAAGLPGRVNGVRIVYRYFVNPRLRSG